jgi:spore cortex biosynthesis protein YabQ
MGLVTQYLTVLAMSVSGAVLGAVYDVYRTILAEWKYLRFLSSILDFVYWIFGLLLVLWALQWANHGDVRIYTILLMVIGYSLYRLLLRKIVVGSTVGMVLAITYVCKVIWRVFMLVFVTPLLWVWSLFLAILRMINRLAEMLEAAILWPFTPLLRTIAWFGRTLYRWTIEPLIEPVVKPIRRQIEKLVLPVRKFVGNIRAQWKGFLKKVANWLVNSDEDDDPTNKR